MRGRFRVLVLALLALVVSLSGAALVSAQTAPIGPGDTVNGTLDVNHPFLLYDFTLDEAVEVTITLEASDFDAYMLLEDADGEVIAEDDDSAGRLNAQIITNLDAGSYVIVATSLRAFRSDYELFASGDFSLALTADSTGAAPPEPDTAPDAQPTDSDVLAIAPGDVLEGELTEDMPEVRYALALDEAQEVTVTLDSDEFDSYLLLILDSSGEIVAEDDDSGGLLNAKIITMLSAGEYKVVVTSLRAIATDGEQIATGEYTVSLTADAAEADGSGESMEEGAGPAPEDSAAAAGDIPGVAVGTIAIDEIVEGELDQATPIALYDLTLEAPLGIMLTLESSEFDAYLVLYDADGVIVAEDDDGGGLLNSQIVSDLDAGEYIVAASSLRSYRSEGDLFEAGSYTLTASLLGAGAEDDNGPAEEPADEPEEPAEEPEQPEEPAEEPEEPANLPEGFIGINDSVEGELTDDTFAIDYTLVVAERSEVTITLESNEFDAYLVLRDATDEIIAEDDDSAGTLNSQIVTTLDAGEYILHVTSFTGYFTAGTDGQTGAFLLTTNSAEAGEGDAPPPSGDNATISIGDTVEGRVGPELPSVAYLLEAEPGTVVTITLTSEDFDTYLEVVASDGEIITTDDDSAGSLDSRITAFVVPDGAPVLIRATSYGAIFREEPESGDFVLSVTEPVVTEIAYGETVESQLDEANNVQVFTFMGEAGDIVNASLETTSFALFVEMTGNGVSAFSTSGMVGPVILPATGEYALTVASFDLIEVEPFSLTLTTVEPQEVAYGERVIDDFDDGLADYYTFAGEEGDVINIRVDTDQAVDTTLRIIAPNGSEITFDDDSGAGFDPEISGFELFESGIYSVVIQPYIPGDNGVFELTVENQAGRSLDDQSYVIRISDKQFVATLSFEGFEGETVTLVARPLTETRAEPRVTVEQDGQLLASNSIGQVASLGISFMVPQDGIVVVKIEDFNGNPSVIEFNLVRVE